MAIAYPVDTEILPIDPLRSWASNERNRRCDVPWQSKAVIGTLSCDHLNYGLGLVSSEQFRIDRTW